MKFSYRQILASAAGAVLSAVVASIFGVKGTIIGVAIGSVAATTGTALAFQSIERTNKAVKQVVAQAPETPLLRRLGGTRAAGVTEATPESSAVAEETVSSASAAGSADRPTPNPDPDPAPDPTAESDLTTAPTRTVESVQEVGPRPRTRPAAAAGGIRWPVAVGAVAAVFVLTLGFVTVVELIAGRPLADLFGHSNGGTTIERIFVNNPTTTTLPAPTTTTTTTSPSSTTTTTTTTSPSSTTTTSLGSTTTSTSGVGSTSTSTSPTGSTTTTVAGVTSATSGTKSG